MSEGKDKAVSMRDHLEALTKEMLLVSPDMEDHVVACCLAVATEELEKWIYDNDWTPSVRPYIDDRDFGIPFTPGTGSNKTHQGPPWKREKKPKPSFASRFPTVQKLKDEGRLNEEKPVDKLFELSRKTYDDWDVQLREIFRLGDKPDFIKAVRRHTGASVNKVHKYVDEQLNLYPLAWGIDNKPGGVCPDCGFCHIEDVTRTMSYGRTRSYTCQDCGLMWGKEPW
jgi:hypothetical protein